MSVFAHAAIKDVASVHREPLDTQTMAHLALSRRREVRQALASRADVPLAIQAILASDSWFAVRATVAHNPSAARSVLTNLASDAHRRVIEALLETPSAPSEALERLAGHTLPTVRMKAARLLLKKTSTEARVNCHPDAKIPELMERAEVLVPKGAFEATDLKQSEPSGGAAMTELDAAIAAAALFSELTCALPHASVPHEGALRAR